MAKLTILMGAPGSGKSTYAAQLGNVVTTDGQQGKAPGQILHEAYRQINTLLSQGKDVVFDTTGANANVRKAALSIAARHGAQAHACVMDTPLKQCLEAQKARTRPVADDTVRRIHGQVSKQAAGLRAEGFSSVTTRKRK